MEISRHCRREWRRQSTFLMHTNGFLLPQRGSITIGEPVTQHQTRKEIREKVDLYSRILTTSLFMPTVFTMWLSVRSNLGLSPDRVQRNGQEALETVGCLALRDKPPHHFPEARRVLLRIASVIAMQPDILVWMSRRRILTQ